MCAIAAKTGVEPGGEPLDMLDWRLNGNEHEQL